MVQCTEPGSYQQYKRVYIPCKVAAVNSEPLEAGQLCRQLSQRLVSHWASQLQGCDLAEVSAGQPVAAGTTITGTPCYNHPDPHSGLNQLVMHQQ